MVVLVEAEDGVFPCDAVWVAAHREQGLDTVLEQLAVKYQQLTSVGDVSLAGN